MTRLVVSGNTLTLGDATFRCAVGKNGFAVDKKEGDNCTPIGTWQFRECWYRADRVSAPETKLPLRIIQPDDGWCDDAEHALYNRHFVIPSICEGSLQSAKDSSHTLGMTRYERLWREDHVCDIVVPLGYNDGPIVPGKGSAIFMHVARPRSSSDLSRHSEAAAEAVAQPYEGTEGCVALAMPDLLEVIKSIDNQCVICISS